MTYEVEMKFPLADRDAFLNRLTEIGAVGGASIEQSDRYFNHPSRDFAETDEAFRLRSLGEKNLVTYKGPKLDPVAKTRHEIEFGYADGSETAGQFAEMLSLLGFRESLTVRKTRQSYHLNWNDREVEIVLDKVNNLGLFVEIETIAKDGADRDPAKDCVLSLAAKLELKDSERRSYLRMLIEKADS